MFGHAPSRLRARLIALASVAMVVLAACGGGGSDAGGGAASEGAAAGGGEPVTLRYSWWGNADRAELVEEAIAAFEEANPGITVQGTFSDYEPYWQKISTEVAGGGAPDVLQMDYSYLREYGDRGALLDLNELTGENLAVDDLLPGLEESGVVDGNLYGVAVGANTFALMYHPDLFAEVGVDPTEGLTWEEYDRAIADITDQTDRYGGTDYTGVFYVLQLKLRQQGKDMFTEDGELGFTEEELVELWDSVSDLRSENKFVPPGDLVAIDPVSPLGGELVASELSWDNFMTRYVDESGGAPVAIAPIPTTGSGELGLYLKPSMLMSASANTEHPEEAAKLIDWFANSAEVGRIMGANRGLPATQAQRDAAELEGVDAEVQAYEESVADQLAPPPPAPPAGAGTLEAEFIRLNEEINYGELSVEDAAAQFMAEAASTLG
jgi:multiple sugar transport system substrate-binding protein